MAGFNLNENRHHGEKSAGQLQFRGRGELENRETSVGSHTKATLGMRITEYKALPVDSQRPGFV